ncbi:MAG: hypothetical protein ACT4OO_10285, partial [Nitrospiraceae bacterium]
QKPLEASGNTCAMVEDLAGFVKENGRQEKPPFGSSSTIKGSFPSAIRRVWSGFYAFAGAETGN